MKFEWIKSTVAELISFNRKADLFVNSLSDISSRICTTFAVFSKSSGSDFMIRAIRTGCVFMLMTSE